MPDEDHGNPKNITTKSLQEAADSNSQNLEETKRNMMESLQKNINDNIALLRLID